MARRLRPPTPTPTHSVPPELERCVADDWLDESDRPDEWPSWMLDGEPVEDRLTMLAWRRWRAARRTWSAEHPDVPVPVSRPRWHDASRVLRVMGG